MQRELLSIFKKRFEAAQQTFVLMKTFFVFVFRRRLQDVLIKTNMFAFDLRLQDVFKTSWSRPMYSSWLYAFKTSSRRFQDVFKTSSRHLEKRLQDIFKTSSRHFEDVKMSSRRLTKISLRRFQDVSSSLTVLVNTFLRSIQHVSETFFFKDGYLQRNMPR